MADEIKNEELAKNNEVESETNSTDESLNTEEQEGTKKDNVDNRIPYDRFKQKVDEANALKEKLAEIERKQEEDKRKELEEQNEYKTLYEQAKKDAEQAKQEALNIKKDALLTQAGYSQEQAKLLVKLVEGEDDEEISDSIKQLRAAIPAQDNYADPSAFNGAKEKPKTVDAEEVGRNAVSRVLHKIKL